MTKKLEETFGFLPENDIVEDESHNEQYLPQAIEEELNVARAKIEIAERVDVALPTVTDMAVAERELDTLAKEARDQSERLMDLGFNVDDRNAGKIFEVAAQLLKTAVDAKTSKIEKKLKVVELQLRLARLNKDSDKNADVFDADSQTTAVNRNELLQAILNKANLNK
jgi:hypothetical protein